MDPVEGSPPPFPPHRPQSFTGCQKVQMDDLQASERAKEVLQWCFSFKSLQNRPTRAVTLHRGCHSQSIFVFNLTPSTHKSPRPYRVSLFVLLYNAVHVLVFIKLDVVLSACCTNIDGVRFPSAEPPLCCSMRFSLVFGGCSISTHRTHF